jgi:hypothetical protein
MSLDAETSLTRLREVAIEVLAFNESTKALLHRSAQQTVGHRLADARLTSERFSVVDAFGLGAETPTASVVPVAIDCRLAPPVRLFRCMRTLCGDSLVEGGKLSLQLGDARFRPVRIAAPHQHRDQHHASVHSPTVIPSISEIHAWRCVDATQPYATGSL